MTDRTNGAVESANLTARATHATQSAQRGEPVSNPCTQPERPRDPLSDALGDASEKGLAPRAASHDRQGVANCALTGRVGRMVRHAHLERLRWVGED